MKRGNSNVSTGLSTADILSSSVIGSTTLASSTSSSQTSSSNPHQRPVLKPHSRGTSAFRSFLDRQQDSKQSVARNTGNSIEAKYGVLGRSTSQKLFTGSKRKTTDSVASTLKFGRLEEEPPSKLQKSIFDTSDRDSLFGGTLFGVVSRTNEESERRLRAERISGEIERYFQRNQQDSELLTRKMRLRQGLETIINQDLKLSSSVYLVGSSLSGFGKSKSDADFCLVLDKNKESYGDRFVVLQLLTKIHNRLRNDPDIKSLQVIRARVPILRFTHVLSGVECDINVNQITGIRNTYLLKSYGNLDRRVKPLVLVIKQWAKKEGINDARMGTLSSYSLTLMVINFLQCGVSPPVLPSLQERTPWLFKDNLSLGEVTRSADRSNSYRSQNSMNLYTLLMKFFEYFGKEFDFGSKVMSVRSGTTTTISGSQLYSRDWLKPIKIEEPFSLMNTAVAVRYEYVGAMIIETFRKASDSLCESSSLDSFLEPKISRNIGLAYFI